MNFALEKIINSIGAGVLVVDAGYQVTYVNSPLIDLLGLKSIGDTTGKTCKSLMSRFAAGCEKQGECPLHLVFGSGEKISMTRSFRKTDGSEVVFEITAIPVTNGNSEVSMMAEIFRDVTEKKKAFLSLIESEEKFRAISETAADAIVVLDNKGLIVHWNRAAEIMFGYRKEEITGRELHRLLAPKQYHDDYRRGFSSFRETGKGPAVGNRRQFIALRKDGSEFPTEVATSAMKIRDRWYAAGIIRDITERKKTEEEITRGREFLASVLDGIGDGVIVVDRDFRIVSANKGYIKQVLRSMSEIRGKKCHEVSHKSEIPCFLAGEDCAVKKTFETGRPAMAIHDHSINGDNPLFVETRSYPIKDKSGNVSSAIEVISDVTEKHRLQEELKQRVKELEDFYDMAVGRELRMIKLKKEIAELKNRLNGGGNCEV